MVRFALSVMGNISFLNRSSRLFTFLKIFYCCGKHQPNSVQLIDLAGTGIVVDGHNVGLGIGPADLFNDTFSHNVIWQTTERLSADDVANAVMITPMTRRTAINLFIIPTLLQKDSILLYLNSRQARHPRLRLRRYPEGWSHNPHRQ